MLSTPGREIHVVVVAGVRRLVVVLRRVALRVEVQRDLARVGLRFTNRVVVHVEADLRARFHQPPGALRKDVGVLAHRVLDEELLAARAAVASGERHGVVRVLHQVADEVMRDLLVADARLGFDRAQPAVFGESGLDDVVAPPVGALRRDLVLPRGDHQIGRAEAPRVVVLELHGRRHVGRVALRCAGIDPFHDRCDLFVGERRIVLELRDADAARDVPRRHVARFDLALDRPRPRPGVLVGQERHRRNRARPVAPLTGALQDGRDVFGERGLRAWRWRWRGGLCGGDGRAGDRPGHPEQNRAQPGESHSNLPSYPAILKKDRRAFNADLQRELTASSSSMQNAQNNDVSASSASSAVMTSVRRTP